MILTRGSKCDYGNRYTSTSLRREREFLAEGCWARERRRTVRVPAVALGADRAAVRTRVRVSVSVVDDVRHAIAVVRERRVAGAIRGVRAPHDGAVVQAPPVARDHCACDTAVSSQISNTMEKGTYEGQHRRRYP